MVPLFQEIGFKLLKFLAQLSSCDFNEFLFAFGIVFPNFCIDSRSKSTEKVLKSPIKA
jgi:hypothetical protein